MWSSFNLFERGASLRLRGVFPPCPPGWWPHAASQSAHRSAPAALLDPSPPLKTTALAVRSCLTGISGLLQLSADIVSPRVTHLTDLDCTKGISGKLKQIYACVCEFNIPILDGFATFCREAARYIVFVRIC